MSLDVSLLGEETDVVCRCCGVTHREKEELFSANITHNLGKMAGKAGIYEALWRPYRLDSRFVPMEDYRQEWEFEDNTVIKAKDISWIIEKGLKDLEARPDYFKKFDSPNGWGLYVHFVPFVKNYLNALKRYPEATVKTSR